MDCHRLGRSGLRVPPLGLGSWLSLVDPDAAPPAEVVAAALDHGIRLFDTADVYDRGAAEEALGRALRDRPRHHLVLATKAYFPMSEDPNDRGLSRKHLSESVDASLRRLGTDYVDLYQCHRFDQEVPLAETVATMGDLIRRGKILYWGTSMWSAEQLRSACRIADAMGVPRPVSEQARYNLLCREVEDEVVPAARALGIGFLWWSPLAQGLLTGKYERPGAAPAGSRGASDRRVGSFLDDALGNEEVFRRIDRLRAVAAEAGCSLAALAISWCLRQCPASTALIGVTRLEQLEQNLAALAVPWNEELERAVEEAASGAPLGL